MKTTTIPQIVDVNHLYTKLRFSKISKRSRPTIDRYIEKGLIQEVNANGCPLILVPDITVFLKKPRKTKSEG